MTRTLSLSATTDADVEAAFAAYEAATRCEDRLLQVDARLQLVLVLQAHGWVAPDLVQHQVERDLQELRQRTGGAA